MQRSEGKQQEKSQCRHSQNHHIKAFWNGVEVKLSWPRSFLSRTVGKKTTTKQRWRNHGKFCHLSIVSQNPVVLPFLLSHTSKSYVFYFLLSSSRTSLFSLAFFFPALLFSSFAKSCLKKIFLETLSALFLFLTISPYLFCADVLSSFNPTCFK